jgi:uncharacterized RDD family membrane protein YckC
VQQTTTAPSAPPQYDTPVGRRCLAAVIDIAILIALFVLYTMAFGETESTNLDGTTSFSLNLEGTAAWGFAAIGILYYFALEAMFGRTPGKFLTGLRVIALDNGYLPPKVALRTVCRIVDVLPAMYLLGFIVMLATRNRQRIGDLAGGTTVVRA